MNRLIAIGDVHGCYDQLYTLITQKLQVTSRDRLVLLGDYIDRGPAIKEVIDYIIGLKEKGYDIVALRGNHEVMMLDSFKTGDFSTWLWNGAESTLASFGLDFTSTPEDKYLRFFESLLWYYEEGNYLFVHAGFNDKDPFNDKHAMIWTRNETYTHPYLKDKIIIHGHTHITVRQCLEIVRSGSSVINIDTGCVYTGPGYGALTAIELNSGELFFSS